ncbi:KTSC domain-containing protein [Serratia marcescens]|nr:KTSC domain-containing protein [Serratia marcescens]ULH13633.1 KTSC domain-containing protein [Serratia marcescens]
MILEVEFKNGSIYQYLYVPYAHYQGLMGASSKGGYLDAYIKKGGYQFKQIK